MFSQNLEEQYIVEYFKGVGKFIDIGAYDVFKFSNTRKLYELGWSGILVEPSPENYKAIADHYKDELRITVLNFAVGDTNGEIDFYSCEDAVSTSDIDHKNKWEAAGVPFRKIKVEQVSALEFMTVYCNGVDFLSIDTEGTNMTVFRNIPDFVFQQIKMICIEHDNATEEIEDRLKPFGFLPVYSNAENIILAK